MTTAVLNTKVSENENEMPNNSKLVTTTVVNRKISEAENKTPDNSKYITTQEFDKLTTENFEARLKQADAVSKTGFDNVRFNRRIT